MGFTITPQDATIRTPMSAGPPKSRPRFSATVREVTATAYLSGAQYADLMSFYKDDLSHGSLPFTQADPETGADASWRFAGPPSAMALRSDGTKVDLWDVSFRMQVLP
ncbi:hypothetical protein [Citreimonas sp.]|uniref:hypothetical protein n=1 Tax=Citreimonas sp. TaxID=3036715 RepID=UPI00405A113E